MQQQVWLTLMITHSSSYRLILPIITWWVSSFNSFYLCNEMQYNRNNNVQWHFINWFLICGWFHNLFNFQYFQKASNISKKLPIFPESFQYLQKVPIFPKKTSNNSRKLPISSNTFQKTSNVFKNLPVFPDQKFLKKIYIPRNLPINKLHTYWIHINAKLCKWIFFQTESERIVSYQYIHNNNHDDDDVNEET